MSQSKQTGHKPAARWHRIRVIAGLLIVCSGWGWMIGSALHGQEKVAGSFAQQQTG